MSDLLDPLFGITAVGATVDDRAWLQALCEVETALARAQARVGLLGLATALEIGAACDELGRSAAADLGREAVAGGNPVIPLVAALRARVRERAGDEAAAAVHLGATSQDVLDTAMMLVASRAVGVIGGELARCSDAAARLAREHRGTALAGRTLLQQAVPTTFGALAAVWGAGLDRAAARLAGVRDALPVSLGGPAGTFLGLREQRVALVVAFADELDLAEPAGVWHAERTVVADLAGALGVAAVAVGKPAGDVVLLAQTELAEVREAAPGGSSSMPHKQNPVAAVTARAGALQAPGLVATLLGGTAELQRAAGSWHAEWPTLTALLRTVGGAASRLGTCLDGLRVDAVAMARNAGGTDGTVDTGAAGDLVDDYLERRGR